MDGSITDWKLIRDWDEALAARPYESGHLPPTIEHGTSYSEAWHWWTECEVTQRNEKDLLEIKKRCHPKQRYWGKRIEWESGD